MQQYRNIDGTYTSPNNGKVYKSEKAFRAHLSYKKTDRPSNWLGINKQKNPCIFCNKQISLPNKIKHEDSCYLNPANIKTCFVCNNIIKDIKNSKGTCSYSCSNKFFRSGIDNGNYKEGVASYASTCYRFHKRECVICGESDAVDVHHLDHNRENNIPENLIPLCPTHHAYCHRGLFTKIEEKINNYIIAFKNNLGVA